MPKVREKKKSTKARFANLPYLFQPEVDQKEKEILRYTKRLDFLAKITKAINKEETLQRTLNLILKSSVRLTDSSCGVLFFKKGGRLESVATYRLKIVDRDKVIRPWRGIVGHVLTTKKAYATGNTDKDRHFVDWGSGKKVHSELSTPIFIDRKVEALLIVSSKEYNHYTGIDVRAAKRLAENAAIAIKKAKNIKELKQLKNFSENVINSSSLGMLVADSEGRVVRFNKAAKSLFSKSILKVDRKIEFPKEVKLPSIDEIIQRLEQDKIPLVFDNVYHFQKRNAAYFNLRIDPLFGEKGELESILLTKENITERVLLENKIKRLNQTLERRVKQRTKKLKLLNEKLKESMESRMQFLADVSHELRTPLTVIQGNTELLLRGKKEIPKDIGDLLSDITKETKIISDRLESLIGLIHEKAEDEEMEMKPFRIDFLIEDMAKKARTIARARKVEVIVKKNPQIKFVGDRRRLKEVLLNLTSNAIKYNRIGGKVWIDVRKGREWLEIHVADTGIGIEKEDLRYIFDRFYRAETIERYQKARGSGIGLAISRFYAKAHGGDIRVRSRVGKGTRFTLVLPLSK